MDRGFVDVADIRTCRDCGRDYLHAFDAAEPYRPIRLEPWSTRGSDVSHGWRLDVDGHAHWVTHIAAVAPAGVFAFYTHYCPAPPRKGTPQVTTDPFGSAAPPGASGPAMNELENKLVLFTLHAIERGIQTSFGPADAAKGELVDLTSGEVHPSHAMWGKVIVPQFAAATPGTKFVGRVTKGTATGNDSPPWTWTDGSAEDKQVALRYLNHANGVAVGATPPAAPAAPTPPPAPANDDPWAPAAPEAAKPPWL